MIHFYYDFEGFASDIKFFAHIHELWPFSRAPLLEQFHFSIMLL